MKASELIAELQKAMAEHGDLPVCGCFECYTIHSERVEVADGPNWIDGERVDAPAFIVVEG